MGSTTWRNRKRTAIISGALLIVLVAVLSILAAWYRDQLGIRTVSLTSRSVSQLERGRTHLLRGPAAKKIVKVEYCSRPSVCRLILDNGTMSQVLFRFPNDIPSGNATLKVTTTFLGSEDVYLKAIEIVDATGPVTSSVPPIDQMLPSAGFDDTFVPDYPFFEENSSPFPGF